MKRNIQDLCIYEAEDGESRTSALKRENEQLKANLSALAQSFAYLKDMPEEDTISHLQDIVRSSRDPLSAMAELPLAVSASALSPNKAVSRAHMMPLNWIEYELTTAFPFAYPFIQSLPADKRRANRNTSWAMLCREDRAGAAARIQ